MDAFVHITGYAGTEVEVRGNGAVATFRLASTPRVRSKGEWSDGNTTWLEVSCFRTLAEHVVASVHRGDALVVVGRLRTSVWEKDGQTHDRLVLEADTVGHDLNRGITMFRRKARPAGDTQDPPVSAEEVPEPPRVEAEGQTATAA